MPRACSDHAVGRWLPVQDPEPFRGVRFSVFGTRDTEERRNAIRPFEARLVALKRSALHVVLAPWVKFVC